MMKKIFFFLFMVNLSVYGQTTAYASITCEVIEAPLIIQNISCMNFGNIKTSEQGNTATVSPTLVVNSEQLITFSNNKSEIIANITETENAYQGSYPSVFFINGQLNANYNISLPEKITITRIGENESMQVNNFTSIPSQKGTLDQKGRSAISIGATLNIAPSQKAGIYKSNSGFEIKVNYY